MEISEERHGDVLELRVKGTVNGHPPQLWHCVRGHLQTGERRLVVNLERVTWVSPLQGFGELLISKNATHRVQGKMALVYTPPEGFCDGPSKPLLESLNTFDTLDEALAFVRGQGDGPGSAEPD